MGGARKVIEQIIVEIFVESYSIEILLLMHTHILDLQFKIDEFDEEKSIFYFEAALQSLLFHHFPIIKKCDDMCYVHKYKYGV